MPTSVKLVETASGKLAKFNGKLVRTVEPGLVYHTDFSRFDRSTCVDVPIFGKYGQWTITGDNKGIVEKTTVTIDGKVHTCLHIVGPTTSGGYIYCGLLNLPDYVTMNDNVVTFETVTYVPSYTGTWGALTHFGAGGCPYYNCWSSSRGLGVWAKDGTARTAYNSYSCKHDNGGWYTTGSTDVARMVRCGTTRVGSDRFKYYVDNKKALAETRTDGINSLYYYASGPSSGWGGTKFEYYVLELKIYKNRDRFEEMA